MAYTDLTKWDQKQVTLKVDFSAANLRGMTYLLENDSATANKSYTIADDDEIAYNSVTQELSGGSGTLSVTTGDVVAFTGLSVGEATLEHSDSVVDRPDYQITSSKLIWSVELLPYAPCIRIDGAAWSIKLSVLDENVYAIVEQFYSYVVTDTLADNENVPSGITSDNRRRFIISNPDGVYPDGASIAPVPDNGVLNYQIVSSALDFTAVIDLFTHVENNYASARFNGTLLHEFNPNEMDIDPSEKFWGANWVVGGAYDTFFPMPDGLQPVTTRIPWSSGVHRAGQRSGYYGTVEKPYEGTDSDDRIYRLYANAMEPDDAKASVRLQSHITNTNRGRWVDDSARLSSGTMATRHFVGYGWWRNQGFDLDLSSYVTAEGLDLTEFYWLWKFPLRPMYPEIIPVESPYGSDRFIELNDETAFRLLDADYNQIGLLNGVEHPKTASGIASYSDPSMPGGGHARITKVLQAELRPDDLIELTAEISPGYLAGFHVTTGYKSQKLYDRKLWDIDVPAEWEGSPAE